MNGDFIIHLEDYADAILGLPAESAGKLFLSLVSYAKGEEVGHLLDDDLLARSIFSIMKTHIDRDREYKELKSRAGKRGGAPVGNSNASKQAETSRNKQKQTEDKQKQTPKPNPKPNPNNKRPYGECANVLLTDDEYKKITDEGLTGLIEELSLYIASKGDKYRSHYAVIKQWANRRKKEQAGNTSFRPNQFTQGVMRTEIDFSDLEKRLVKN